ncbi:putative phage tail protein [Aliivibrio fischeri ES114]|uniref:Phage tail protein n=1 Tax=Aliivibrio fischeri (strain ATCC 700601 / ES114) TaxID=312309 RepID=Q5E381_ALIF1|nr:tail fiber protein [Aliivibrio fischeri]AAW86515.1 putative phage tail protein [Aliivibrio fischeri ES114]
MSLLITDAGIAAATAAGDLGVSYKIAYISVGTEGYIPTVGQTELKNEVARVEITKGFDNGNGQLHGEAVFDGDNEFIGKELGYHLTDGTLFAVDSRGGEIISVKRSNTIVTEAFDLNLANSSIDNITVAITGVTAATDEDIDNKAQTKRMVLLPQLWRALDPILARANEALNVAHSKWTYVQASLTTYGATKLSSAINSTSESLAATSKAVKLVADIANSKITKAQADLWYWKRGETVTNSTRLNNRTNSIVATASTMAERDSTGDLHVRLLRSNYQDESAISGGLVFRKSVSDNYHRVCTNVAAIRTWLSVFSKAEGDERYVGTSKVSSSTTSSSPTNVANSAAVKAAMDRANAAYDKAGTSGNKVYTGTSSGNTDFPIGTPLVAWIGGTAARNSHTRVYNATAHAAQYGTDTYGGHKGSYLAGTWSAKGRAATIDGVGQRLYQRVL